MKRTFIMIMISGLLLTFTACSQMQNKLSPNSDRGTQQESTVIESTDASEAQSSETQQDSTLADDTYTDAKSTDTTGNKSKTDTGIVAKSDNVVASVDKAVILKDMDKKLDELFKSMNDLEDLQDSDLE